MKKNSLFNLRKKIKKYKILIFDLDNTIYDQNDYDYPAIRRVSKFISSKINLDEKKIFKQLISMKEKNLKNIFDNFLKKKKIVEPFLKKLVIRCVNLFQNYKCEELRMSKSLYNDLNYLSDNKILYLVTNGNTKRQKRKIKFLKIEKFFKKIYILDGKKNELKPSIKNVKRMHSYIIKNEKKNALFIGDNKKVDKNFAKNLGIEYFYFSY